MKGICFACLLIIFLTVLGSQAKQECVGDMITYAYTECDSNKGRWRVAIPRNDQCQISKPDPPVLGTECGFSCAKGEYLDLDTQECKLCPPGTYSLGSGIQFNSWDTIPDGFIVSSTSFSFSEYGYHAKVENCSTFSWKPQNDHISSNDNDCTGVLTYAVDLKTKGSVSFTYQFTDDDMIFHFYVQNGECQSFHDNERNVFLNTTGTSWHKYSAELDEGTNVLIWKTTGLLLGTKEKLRPALIKDIEIYGVSYTTTCHQCSSGYFTDTDGSDWCKPCPENTFSNARAQKCTPCNSDTHYSHVASSSCTRRPACTESDYFETHLPCSANKTTRVTYKWHEPKICSEDDEGSVKLPSSGIEKECPPCNAGFHPSDSGKCVACLEGTFSDGKTQCQKCSIGTSPNHGFYYNWWDVLPEHVAVSCITIHSEECLGEQGWISSGVMIKTSSSETPVAYLLLKLEINGFRSYKTGLNGVKEYGNFTVVFELDCSENCVMYLMKNVQKGGSSILGTWHGKTAKQSFTYTFIKNEVMNLTWAYQKTNHILPGSVNNHLSMDCAKIYSIVVTNANGAPADSCQSCGAGVSSAGCVPCPAGHFITGSEECVPCLGNTYEPYETVQDSNCTACLEGTTSNKERTACQNNCHFFSKLTGRKYDFSTLSQPQLAMSPPGFTNSGRKYVHYYNFSICGNYGFGMAECFDNKSLSKNLLYGAEKVQAMICRSTKIFTTGAGNEQFPIFTQPEIISVQLEKVFHQHSDSSDSSDEECNKNAPFFPPTTDPVHGDVVYVFSSNDPSTECSEGKRSYLHVRCDPTVSANDAFIEMPVKYPDGSCDGCNFHFLWKSIDACPLCTEDDYYAVEGACKDGSITTRYMWISYPKSCKDGVNLPDYSKAACVELRLYVEIGVLAAIVLLVILIAVSCSLWKKSRKLEYKYQKLVMDSGKNSGKLPAADSCGISSSEPEDSDNEEVMFRRKREKMLGKTKDGEKIPLNTMHQSINT